MHNAKDSAELALDDKRTAFLLQLFLARNRYRFAMDDVFRPMGVTDATWRTLFYLEQQGNGIQQKDLAHVMGIERPSLVRLLDQLEQKQLIERKPSPVDRRGKTVHLTAAAHELLSELHDAAGQVRARILHNINNEELDICISVFSRMLEASMDDL
ncbi:MAG: MarR family transcriptional regulator [Pseudomonadales bacterium]|nr:MarR family transcriptional regulator [Pseudomonadales bacterium]